MGSVGSGLRMGVRNGFVGAGLIGRVPGRYVGGPTPPGHPVLATHRVFALPAVA
jgi:hypothetical protein